MDLSFAMNKTKAQMALARVQKRYEDERAINPGKEIPAITAEDVKAEYVRMAGLLVSEEVVTDLEERAKHNDFVNTSGAVEKTREIVNANKSNKKK